MKTYLALLRGINVGGHNIIKKDDLRQCFEDLGFQQVQTYIQSGNIIFQAKPMAIPSLATTIEAALAKRFDYDAHATVLTHTAYAQVIDSAPRAWGTDENQKHNILFPLHDVSMEAMQAALPAPIKKIESICAGAGAVFWSVAKQDATKAAYMKLPTLPIYKQMTIRNSNTALKLLDMLHAM